MHDPRSELDRRQAQEAKDEVSENRATAMQMIEEMTPENFRLFWDEHKHTLGWYATRDHQEIPF